MVDSTDSIDRFERTFERRIRFFIGTLFAGCLFPAGFLAYLFLAFPGTVGAWILVYIPIELVFAVVMVRWFRRRLNQVKSLPRTMRHRLAPSGIGKRPIFILDNGLVVTSGFQFRMFGSPAGGTMIPTSEELAGLERGMLRMRTALRIFRNRGPEPVRMRLNSIHQALNARFSSLLVLLPRPSYVPDARHAPWVASANFEFGFKPLDPNRILQQIDSLASLLEDAAKMARGKRS